MGLSHWLLGTTQRAAGFEAARTIARWSGQEIVLAKSTFSGAGEFVWVWSVNADGTELVQRGTGRSWDSDFEKRPAEGQEIRFRLASADEPAITSLGQRMARSGNVVTVATEILVNVNTEATVVLVQCLKQDCTIADIENGARVRRRSLPRGQVASIPTGLEVNIEPVPGSESKRDPMMRPFGRGLANLALRPARVSRTLDSDR